jgi:hypothetical protein
MLEEAHKIKEQSQPYLKHVRILQLMNDWIAQDKKVSISSIKKIF